MTRMTATQNDKSGPSNVPHTVILKRVVEERGWEAFISTSFQKKSETAGKKYMQHPKTEMDMESSRWRENKRRSRVLHREAK